MSIRGVKVSLGATSAFLVLLALLHVLQPEFGPLWRFVSEYSNGLYGWVMKLAFLLLALACVALIPVLRPQVRSKSGKIGVVLLGITAVGLTLAAFFNQDPITSRETTFTGSVHAFATLLGIPGFSLASLLIGVSLARNNPEWRDARMSLLWLSNFAWLSFVGMMVYMALVMPQAGGFGPTVWVGLINRIFLVAMCSWLIFVAWHSAHLQPRSPGV